MTKKTTKTLNSRIMKAIGQRTVNGLTVGEIYDNVYQQVADENWAKFINADSNVTPYPAYPTVRARVYELANKGTLVRRGVRADSNTNVNSTTFTRRPAFSISRSL